MRLTPTPDSLIERIGLALRKVPVPPGVAFTGMAIARAIVVAQSIGMFGALARRPMTVDELAAELQTKPVPTRMLADILTGQRILELDHGRYGLSREAAKWMDPSSPSYMGTFTEHTGEFWGWWSELDRFIRDGVPVAIHDRPPDDPSWPIYVRGQYELARLSATRVAGALKLPDGPLSVLDVAGSHGWYAATVCARRPGSRALVVDLPGSAAPGREIMAENGLSDTVTHVEGDMFETDLGGPHDIALVFLTLQHLSQPQRTELLRRVRAALKPTGSLAVLDIFRPGGRERRASAAIFELFFNIASGSDVASESELADHLDEAGFARPRRIDLRAIPDLRLYQAQAA